jgi:hypothetical protein
MKKPQALLDYTNAADAEKQFLDAAQRQVKEWQEIVQYVEYLEKQLDSFGVQDDPKATNDDSLSYDTELQVPCLPTRYNFTEHELILLRKFQNKLRNKRKINYGNTQEWDLECQIGAILAGYSTDALVASDTIRQPWKETKELVTEFPNVYKYLTDNKVTDEELEQSITECDVQFKDFVHNLKLNNLI